MSGISGISGSNDGLLSTNANNMLITVAANSTLNTLATSAINPFSSGPFANLDLSSTQQTQLQQILQDAQTQGLSPAQVQGQINAVLTPTQQATLQKDLQGLRHDHKDGNSRSSASASNDDTDEFGIPKTITSASTTGAGAISNIAASYSVQSQYQDSD